MADSGLFIGWGDIRAGRTQEPRNRVATEGVQPTALQLKCVEQREPRERIHTEHVDEQVARRVPNP